MIRFVIALVACVLGVPAVNAGSYRDVVLSQAPILYWPLDETSGVVAENFGTLGIAANGTFGSAVDYGGSPLTPDLTGTSVNTSKDVNSRVLLDPFSMPSSAVSVSFWVQGEDTGLSHFFGYAGTGGSDNEFTFGSNNGELRTIVRSSSIEDHPGVDVLDGTAHHIGLSWSTAGNLLVYVDGNIAVSRTVATGAALFGNGALVLSQDLDSLVPPGYGFEQAQAYAGAIDEFAIFDRLLSDDEFVVLATGVPEPTSDRLLPNATYLQPANPLENPADVGKAFKIDLATDLSFAVTPGDYIRLRAVGDFDFASADDNLGGPFGNGTLADAWGVFSSDGELEDVDLEAQPLSHRVLASVPVLDGDANPVEADANGFVPDQPDDFIIPSEMGSDPNGVVVRVPEGATHLFLGAADEVWSDNTDEEPGDYDVLITSIDAGRLVGDYNLDGIVDAADYTVWRDSEGEMGIDPAADGDLDGDVDADDLLVWQSGYGTIIGGVASASDAVPEPGSSILIILALSSVAFRSRLAQRDAVH